MSRTTSSSSSRHRAAAHVDATRLPFAEVVRNLTQITGRKLAAYIAGVDDTRSVERWINGQGSYGEVEPRLRFAYQVVFLIAAHDPPAVVQSWLTGINPELGDRTPLRLLREGDLEAVGRDILRAASSFVAGG